MDKGDAEGIVPLETAMRIAEESQLDLVEIAPKAKPPVCKVMDYGKFIYESEKKEKEAKKKQKVIVLKEIKMRPNIDTHDYETKKKKILIFLSKDYKVKVTMEFRGRQNMYKDRGRKILEELIEEINENGKVETPIKHEGRKMFLVFTKI